MSYEPHTFPSRITLRLDWSEMDLYGHINNVAYLKYVQASRVNYWSLCGIDALYQQGIMPVVAEITCAFKQPLHFPGNIIVKASVSWMKESSFGFHHHICREDDTIAAIADDTMVLRHVQANTKAMIPEQIRSAVETIERKSF